MKLEVSNFFSRGRKPKGRKPAQRAQEDPGEEAKPVVCGRCNITLDAASWKNHKERFHNDLAWKLGEPAIVRNPH